MNEQNPTMYIGQTSQGIDKALAEVKNRIKHVKDSKKLAEMKIDVSKLDIVFLRNSTPEKVNDDVNFFINKYDTLNNGWNSILR